MANRNTIRPNEFQALLGKYLAGEASDAERTLLESWYLDYEAKPLTDLTPEQLDVIRRSSAPSVNKTHIWRLRRWVAAAAAILIASTAAWLVLGDRWPVGGDRQLAAEKILPGGNRATLTLADGRTIDLSETQTGILIKNEGITYDDGSALDAISRDTKSRRDNSLLELTTPKGGTYQITLPDGSRVWLNANSTLKYPSRFSGDSRDVFLDGEAFFEIRPQAGRVGANLEGLIGDNNHSPFSVRTANQVVNVLGTQFNISAYAEDAETKTTLVEGKVRVVGANPEGFIEDNKHSPYKTDRTFNTSGVTLSPGEQATIRGVDIETRQVDPEQFIAWKNGYFLFENEPLESVMKKLAKWYDIEFSFADDVKGERFYGMIGRDKNLGQVLRMLENTKTVRFTVVGNQVKINKV